MFYISVPPVFDGYQASAYFEPDSSWLVKISVITIEKSQTRSWNNFLFKPIWFWLARNLWPRWLILIGIQRFVLIQVVNCSSLMFLNTKQALNPYPWILKKSKTPDHHRACFAEKNPERSIEKICIYFCALHFFQKTRSATVPKMAYIFVQHGIFPLILAYAIWHLYHKVAQLTHIICTYNFYFLSLNCDVTSDDPDFFSKKNADKD